MDIFHFTSDIQESIKDLKSRKLTIGFVPTMGALHQGHLSLAKKALEQNNIVVVSVFVNPTQFDNQTDLKKYPRSLESDVGLLKTISESKIIVYAPSVDDMYGNTIKSTHFNYDGLEHEMEGRFRTGHFDGVGTIVKRFFEIVKPDRAYFGEKDFQQLMIIKKLVVKYHIPVEVIGCKIYREDDGLAMSSRNERLKPEYRATAPFIYKTLKEAKVKFKTQSGSKVTKWIEEQFSKNEHLELEYFIIADIDSLKTIKRKSSKKLYRGFIAVYADEIRLIDNIALN